MVEPVMSLLVAVFYVSAGLALLDDLEFNDYMAFFTILLAFYYLIGAVITSRSTWQDKRLHSFLVVICVGLATLSIMLQFERYFIITGWFLEALALMLLGIKTRIKNLYPLSVVVYFLALFVLPFMTFKFRPEAEVIFLNQAFITSLIGIIIAYTLVFLFKFKDKQALESEAGFNFKVMYLVFSVLANFLTLFAVSVEILAHYSGLIYELLDSNAAYSLIESKINEGRIILSLFWLLYAIGLLVVGFLKRYKGLRLGGILLLVFSIIKLFFWDLWNLGTSYRIVVSISLGVILIVVSFVYNKYKSRIKEMI
ncbi:MAG: DUF2339 domain-containing protein [Candidatus Moranbacteria bacterium]|nr:DUF2339 domain-containing protein [Candidatus Moranbacteria bacterium]